MPSLSRCIVQTRRTQQRGTNRSNPHGHLRTIPRRSRRGDGAPGMSWLLAQTLTASDAVDGDAFGLPVCLARFE